MNYVLFLPELLVAGLGLLLLVVHLLWRTQDGSRSFGYFTAAGLAAIALYAYFNLGVNQTTLEGTWVSDPLAAFFKLLFLLAGILVALSSISYLRVIKEYFTEYLMLVVFATLSMMLVVSAGDLISLYIGLEFMAICFCVLTCYLKTSPKSPEAALKYIVINAFSSAVLLYGFSLLFGLTGSVSITGITQALTASDPQPAVYLALVLVLAGFSFKTSLVPFHMWTPDVYEGAPTPITNFFAIGSKAAGFGLMIRVFLTVFSATAGTLVLLLAVLSFLTFTIGNLVALPQTNIKRFLAYASIGSAGYIIMGLVAGGRTGVEAILFYLMINVFSTFGAFGVASVFGSTVGTDEIADYAGLSKRSPFLALVMLLSTLSLAGVPGLAGFVAKFYVFLALVHKGFAWLALVGVVISIVSVFYFLRLAKVMYVYEASEKEPVRVDASMQLALAASMVVTVVFGVYPTPLVNLVGQVAQAFLP